MTHRFLAPVLLLALLAVSACAAGTPYRVETRTPESLSQEEALKQQVDQTLRARRQDEAKSGR